VTGTGTAGQVAYWSSSSAITGESNLFWDATNDRLGIGTATPLSFLDISSGTNTDIIRFGASSRWGFRRENNDNRYVAFYRGLSSTPSAVWTVDGDNGNVGVNTSSPGERFTVNGYVGLQRSGTQIWHYGVDSSNSLEFVRSGIATRMILSSDGNLGLGVTPSAWGSQNTVLQLVNNTSLISRSNFTSLARNLFYTTSDVAAYISNGVASNYLQIDAEHRWYFAGSGTSGATMTQTQAMTLTSGGNLLVGTTTDAGFKLDVNGTSRFSGAYFATNDTPQTAQATITRHSVVGLVSRGVTASVFDWSIYSAGGTALIVNPTGTNNINFNGAQVYFTGGNVGIGTTSPNYPLEIRKSGGAWSTSDDSFGAVLGVYYNTANTGGTQNRFRLLADQNAVYLDGYDAVPLIFRNNGNTERMRITSGGNVLIGTTTDVGAKLHLNGDIRTAAPSGGSAVNWKLGTARGGTITPNAIVRVEIGGVLVDLDARYV
jgi:hypothetical protein